MAEILFSFDVCAYVSVCLCAADRSIRTVKVTDFKFDKYVPRESPDMTLKIFRKGGVAKVT